MTVPAQKMLSQTREDDLVTFIRRKTGVQRGPDRAVYGDDLVQVLLLDRVDVRALAQESFDKLDALWASGAFIRDLVTEARAAGYLDFTARDAVLAVQSLHNDLRLKTHDSAAAAQPVAEMPGLKTYKSGTEVRYYFEGLQLGEVVLDPAANGPWNPAQRPETVIRDMVKAKLPWAAYVRHYVNPDHVILAKRGHAALESARRAGMSIDPMRLTAR